MSTRHGRDLAFCAAATAVLASVVSALSCESAGAFPVTLIYVAPGPFSGWIAAVSMGDVVQGLSLLVPVTLAVLIPLLVYVRSGAHAALGLVPLFWVLSGWYFTIGMWV
ncbi:MAG: hypothetical protein JW751_16125 [Polyangiaceae bacterium]|nr:hypothetical protein [Polyangiaceae bacterium]